MNTRAVMQGSAVVRNVLNAWRLLPLLAAASIPTPALAAADGAVCARVKIEIRQELTMERQGFDAEMVISNGLTDEALTNIDIDVSVTDEQGVPVLISSDPSNTTAKFFIRVSNQQGIGDVDGAGQVGADSTATINWLLIPAPGAAGVLPTGKKYLVGATLKYRVGTEDEVVVVSPDVITVRPMPLLTLDYFMPQNVHGDDPFTPGVIEAPEPFILGVRVKNTGMATAKDLKIESAQPKIVDNVQSLLINFQLTGSSVNDLPVQNSLLANFGDVLGGTSETARWIMETSLSGHFTEFNVRFTHAAELGGQLTSLLQATSAHFLVHDVRVDLPGRDFVRDFLALDDNQLRVYESSGVDSDVADVSGLVTLAATAGGSYRLTVPPDLPGTENFVYVKKPDPYAGQMVVGTVLRSDGKTLPQENVWLSRTQNPNPPYDWSYWVNFFDAKFAGVYDAAFENPPPSTQAPVIGTVIDRTVQQTQQISFVVEASSPEGKPVTLTAAPLPVGATFTIQPPDPQAPTLTRAIFDWTPTDQQSGNYYITYTATDGSLASTKSAAVTVYSYEPPPGPAIPTIHAPAYNAAIATTMPLLEVDTTQDPQDPTQQIDFELYADEAMTVLVASGSTAEAQTGPTGFLATQALTIDNHWYWWRARAYDGTSLYSQWRVSKFFLNTANDGPENFNLASPGAGTQVTSLLPTLSWMNTTDVDGDAITYSVQVYADAAATQLVASATGLSPDIGETSSWVVDVSLTNHATYYWRVTATDALGASTSTSLRAFIVNTGNTLPTPVVLSSPAQGAALDPPSTDLVVANSTDADGDLITYVFELDTVATFDSSDKRNSGSLPAGAGGFTSWTASNLVDGQHYYWRVKAQDGMAETAWSFSDFTVNDINHAPPVPTIANPGDNSWVNTTTPAFSVNPVVDLDNDAVTYEFEIYKALDPATLVTSGSSATTTWTPSAALVDYTSYEWRVRAVDALGAASAWSARSTVSVSAGSCCGTAPEVVFLNLTDPTIGTLVNGRRIVHIEYDVNSQSLEPEVELYWNATNSGAGGTLFAGPFRYPSVLANGSHPIGSYDWDITDLPSGSYYVYAKISNAQSTAIYYAAGGAVVPSSAQGQVTVAIARAGPMDLQPPSGDPLRYHVPEVWTNGVNYAATYVGWRADINMWPKSGMPISWATSSSNPRRASLSGAFTFYYGDNAWLYLYPANNCLADGNEVLSIISQPAVTMDPDFAGVQLPPMSIVIDDDDATAGSNTNIPEVRICMPYTGNGGNSVPNEPTLADYYISFLISNAGTTNIMGGSAVVVSPNLPAGWTLIDDALTLGAIGPGDTSGSGGSTIILRGPAGEVTNAKYHASQMQFQVTLQ